MHPRIRLMEEMPMKTIFLTIFAILWLANGAWAQQTLGAQASGQFQYPKDQPYTQVPDYAREQPEQNQGQGHQYPQPETNLACGEILSALRDYHQNEIALNDWAAHMLVNITNTL